MGFPKLGVPFWVGVPLFWETTFTSLALEQPAVACKSCFLPVEGLGRLLNSKSGMAPESQQYGVQSRLSVVRFGPRVPDLHAGTRQLVALAMVALEESRIAFSIQYLSRCEARFRPKCRSLTY